MDRTAKGGFYPDKGGKVLEKTPFIEIRGLRKVYKLGKERVVALDDINLTIERGRFAVFWELPVPASLRF